MPAHRLITAKSGIDTRRYCRHSARTAFFACLLGLCLFAAPALSAAADDRVVSGRELYDFCRSQYDTDAGYCVGYVAAIANRMSETAVAGYGPCRFGAARSQQFAELFIAYAENYPDSLSAPADSLIAAALARAFACPKP